MDFQSHFIGQTSKKCISLSLYAIIVAAYAIGKREMI